MPPSGSLDHLRTTCTRYNLPFRMHVDLLGHGLVFIFTKRYLLVVYQLVGVTPTSIAVLIKCTYKSKLKPIVRRLFAIYTTYGAPSLRQALQL